MLALPGLGTVSEVQHSAPVFKAATATVIRALDGLDPSSKLAVLALAGRVTLRTHSGALFFDPASTPLEVGQFWITPKQRIANRTIVLITDTDIGFDNRRGRGMASVREFRDWIRRYDARPLP